jgi:hypothetical protein
MFYFPPNTRLVLAEGDNSAQRVLRVYLPDCEAYAMRLMYVAGHWRTGEVWVPVIERYLPVKAALVAEIAAGIFAPLWAQENRP